MEMRSPDVNAPSGRTPHRNTAYQRRMREFVSPKHACPLCGYRLRNALGLATHLGIKYPGFRKAAGLLAKDLARV